MTRDQQIQQARRILAECLIIDTETTGLGDTDVIIELAAVDGMSGEVVINTLVKTDHPISDVAAKVNGITPEMLAKNGADAEDILIELFGILAAEKLEISAFNLSFDARMLDQTEKANDLQLILHGFCIQQNDIMELANRYLHEHLEWDTEHSKFKRLSLARCLEITGIQHTGNAHRALSDARAARDLLVFIAEGRKP